jgi:hypothetical protein
MLFKLNSKKNRLNIFGTENVISFNKILTPKMNEERCTPHED